MKNILIPTTHDADTLLALKVAAGLKQNESFTITLLTASPLGDSITALLFPSRGKEFDPIKRQQLLDDWSALKSENNWTDISLAEHHQYGVSGPVLSHVLERFYIDMIIVPYSFQQSKVYSDRQLTKLLYDSKIPLMLLPNESDVPEGIHRALYLDEQDKGKEGVVQNLPFHVIHQSMVTTSGMQSMRSIVANFRINLIVMTKKRESKVVQGAADLGLPVLTI